MKKLLFVLALLLLFGAVSSVIVSVAGAGTKTKSRRFTKTGTPTDSPTDDESASFSKTKGTESISEDMSMSFTKTKGTESISEDMSMSFTKTKGTESISEDMSMSFTKTKDTVSFSPTDDDSASLTRTNPTDSISDDESASFSKTKTKGTESISGDMSMSFTPTDDKSATFTKSLPNTSSDTMSMTSHVAWDTPSLSESQSLSVTESELTADDSMSFSSTESKSPIPTETDTISMTSHVAWDTPSLSESPSVTADDSASFSVSDSRTLPPTRTQTFTLTSVTKSGSETQSVSNSRATADDSMSFSVSESKSLPETASKIGTRSLTSLSVSREGDGGTHSQSPSDDVSLTASTTQSISGSDSLSITGETSSKSRELTKSNFTYTETISPTWTDTQSWSVSADESMTLDTDSHSDTTSISPTKSGTLSYTASLSPTFSHSISFSMSLSYSDSGSRGGRGPHVGGGVGTETLTITRSQGRDTLSRSLPSLSESDSMPLTTSQMPPTTTPLPTPTRTLMTECPPFCGKGVCSNTYPFYCVCFASERLGFWSKEKTLEGTCDRCKSGFFGIDCNRQCPGGTCATCGGHGTCDEGITGSGLCSCYNNSRQGFWTGTSCGVCTPRMYGDLCASECACVNGLCDQGRYGTGRCDCTGTGFMGARCETCDPSQRSNCEVTLACPNGCSGHGTCENNGGVVQCRCYTFWATNDCSQRCPFNDKSPGKEVCYGHGICLDGQSRSGVCQCDHVNFVAINCSTCVQGFWGSNCSNICPTGSTTPCSGHGHCRANDGGCTCYPGWGSSSCQTYCPTTVPGATCSGHGACGAVSGVCECYTDQRGYWTGADCSRCTSQYSGVNCDVPCPLWPRGGGGAVCSGHGLCERYNSTCTCSGNYCGVLCEAQLEASNGTCMSCDGYTGVYGVNCSSNCLCVNGVCSEGRAGDGSCRCREGHAGRYCNETCFGGAANPCSGHGRCDPATTRCVCAPGYAGQNCSLRCPILDCSGHGRCDDGFNGTGNCFCDAGWVFNKTGCDRACPCLHGGQCDANLTCMCPPSFNGTLCERCKDGLAGPACDQICGGITNGTDCICVEGFGGPKCDIPCPKGNANGLVCSGPLQGKCQSLTAKCECLSGFYGPSCNCSDALCAASNQWTECNQVSGVCKCNSRRDPTDRSCDTCKRGSWGTLCDQECSCSGNGACDKLTGAQCYCDLSDTYGYWQGSSCDSCATGYMGSKCKQKSIAVTTLSPAFVNYPVFLQNLWSTLDEKRSMYYVGGEKSIVYAFNMSVGLPVVKYIAGNPAPCASPNGGDISHVWHDPWESDKLRFLLRANSSCSNPVRVLTMPMNSTFYSAEAKNVLNGLASDFIRYAELIPSQSVICYVPERQTTTDSFQLGCRDLNDAISTTFPLPVAPFDPVTSIRWIPKVRKLLVTGAIGATCGFSFSDLRKVGLAEWEGGLQQQFIAQTPRVNCRSIDVSYFVEEYNLILLGAMAIEGVLISGVDFSRNRVIQSEIVHPSQQLRCVALMLHKKTSVGLGAFGNMLIKFRIALVGGTNWTITAYGQQLMGNSLTLIRTFDLIESQRVVLAPRRSYPGVQILRFLLIEVTAVYPPIADARGGTLVVVTGNGFNPEAPNPVCRFADIVVPAQVVNETHMTCVVPQSKSAEVCETNAAEVSLNNFSFTANKVIIKRPTEPIVISAEPPRMRIERPAPIITVTGRGFEDSPVLRCKFFFKPLPVQDNASVIVRATFRDATTVLCHVGNLAQEVTSSFGSGILISLDGQLYSTTFAPFSVVGPVVGISCLPNRLQNGSLPLTEFSTPILVQTFDRERNLLTSLDTVNRSATVNATPAVFNIIKSRRGTLRTDEHNHLVFRMVNGVATVDGMQMDLPPVDVLAAQIFVDRTWSCPFTFVITAGQLKTLRIKVQPLSPGDLLLPTALLPQTTEVELIDDGGNVVTGLENIVVNVTLLELNMSVTPPRVQNMTKDLGLLIARDTGVCSFPPQILPIVFGSFYILRFQVISDGKVAADTVPFTPGCPRNMFQVFGESQCRECMHRDATCNGSNILVAREGFWRMDPKSLIFYPCPIERACPNASEFTGCAEGYQGILCNDCAPSYAKDFSGKCKYCEGIIGDILILALGILGVFLVLAVATLLYVQNCLHDETASGKIGTTLAISMTMLQTLSLLSFINISWPSIIFQLLSALETFFDFRIFNFLSADCLFRRMGIDSSAVFLFYGAVILFALGIPWIVRLIVKTFPNALMTPDAVEDRLIYMQSAAYQVQFATADAVKGGAGGKSKRKKKSSSITADIDDVAMTTMATTSATVNNNSASATAGGAADLATTAEIDEKAQEEAKKQEEFNERIRHLKQHQPKSILLNSLQVVLFFGIQPALRSAFEVLPCTHVVDYRGIDFEVMEQDVRVSCQSTQYIGFKVTAIVFVVTYAMIVPFLYGLGAAYYRFRYFDTFYKTYMGFSACGMTDELWYWIPTILLRKIWLVIIVSFLQPPINLYFFVWSMMAFAWFAYSRRPYKSKHHIFLENLCNLNVIVTGNIAMTIHVVDNPEGLAANMLQGVALIMNTGVLFVLGSDMIKQLMDKTVLSKVKAALLSDMQKGKDYEEEAVHEECRLQEERETARARERGEDPLDELDVIVGSASVPRDVKGASSPGSGDDSTAANSPAAQGERRVMFVPGAKARGRNRGARGGAGGDGSSSGASNYPSAAAAAAAATNEEDEDGGIDFSGRDIIAEFAGTGATTATAAANERMSVSDGSSSAAGGGRRGFKAFYEPALQQPKQPAALGAMDDYFGRGEWDEDAGVRILSSTSSAGLIAGLLPEDDAFLGGPPLIMHAASSTSLANHHAGPDPDLISEEELTAALHDCGTSLSRERSKIKALLEKTGGVEAKRDAVVVTDLDDVRRENAAVRTGAKKDVAGVAAQAAKSWLSVEADPSLRENNNNQQHQGGSAAAAAASSSRFLPLSQAGAPAPQQEMTVNSITKDAFSW